MVVQAAAAAATSVEVGAGRKYLRASGGSDLKVVKQCHQYAADEGLWMLGGRCMAYNNAIA
jgi:hypothetical protein